MPKSVSPRLCFQPRQRFINVFRLRQFGLTGTPSRNALLDYLIIRGFTFISNPVNRRQ